MSDSIIGEITPPSWIPKHGELEPGPDWGLFNFFVNLIRLSMVVAGIFAFVNLIFAGYGILASSGDPERTKKATAKIWNSIIGLLIMAASFTLAAVFGWLLFGDATFILKPVIYGVGVD